MACLRTGFSGTAFLVVLVFNKITVSLFFSEVERRKVRDIGEIFQG